MIRPPFRAIGTAALAVLALSAFACGDDDDDPGNMPSPTEGATDRAPSGSPTAPPGGDIETTSGHLEVNGEDLVFDVAFCGYSAEETGAEAIPFAVVGTGDLASGDPFTINAAILDLSQQDENLGEVHVIEVYDETAGQVLYTSAHDPEGDEFLLNGSHLSMTAEFANGTGEQIVGEGIFEADCPG